MKRFIADGDWKILWGICSIVPFGIAFFLNWIFGSSGGWEALSLIKLLLLFTQIGFITVYFLKRRLNQAVISLWGTVFCLWGLSMIVPVLATYTTVILNMTDTSMEMSTPLYLFLSCLSASWLLPGRWRMVSRIVWVIFILLYCLIQFTYIGYYIVAHSLISVNMMLAIAQTNIHEALSFISVNIPYTELTIAIVSLFLLGYIFFRAFGISIEEKNYKVSKRFKFILIALLLLNMGMTVFTFCQTRVAQVFAQSKETLQSFAEFQRILDSRRNMVIKDKELQQQLMHAPDGVYILIIGESETRDHMGVYGYERDNTPFQSQAIQDEHYTFFNHVYSSYTQTVQTLTYALSEKNQYNDIPLIQAYSIIDMARAAGFKTTWISNQSRFGIWDTPIGAIGSACDDQHWMNDYIGTGVQTKDYDDILIPELKKVDPNNRRQLIVIHLMGSHVSYWDRYPHNFYRYPIDQTKQRTKDQIMIDEYDNSVLFNDFVLEQIMDTAINYLHADQVIYFSDHGERVTEKPGHNADEFNFMMVHIPFWIYTSNEYQESHATLVQTMKRRREWLFTNDMLYDTLMGGMGLTAVKYDPTADFFSMDYDKNIDNVLTMYGNVWVSKDTQQLGENFKNP